MKRVWAVRVLAVLAVLGLTVTATSAEGDTVTAKAKLSGFQENLPKLTNGTGSFEATISGGKLSYKLTYSGLSSPALMAHIHFAQPGVNGSIFLWLCQTATNPGPAGTPICPAAGGTVTRTGVSAADIQGVPSQNLTAADFAGALRILQSGDAYVNVHTTNFPGGEIRGQVRTSSQD